MARAEMILTTTELQRLLAYSETQSKHRTYRLVRDSRNVLHVLNPDGRLIELR